VAGEPDAARLAYPELSPDGHQVAISRTVQGNTDIWLMDLVRGGMTRFTFDVAIDTFPVWSPDGMRIAFGSNRKGATNLYVKPSSGAGAEQPLLETPNAKGPVDWSKDGRFLLYVEADAKSGLDLWALPVTGSDRKPIAVAKTAFAERNGQFSPNGRWVAYETTSESGQFQIVVQSFPEPTGKWQVSTGGGTQARWRADGKELYFIAPDGNLMAASITVEGSAFAAGTPVALFPTSIVTGGTTAIREEYAVSRDGRFLINQPIESSATPITLILNWHPERGK
jgi:Tol biopolymer transport system component